MSAADKITAARALIEPLTGYSPGPWEVVTDLPAIAIAAGNHRVVQTPNQNNYRHFGRSEPWLGIGTFSNAALIAAAPALRDTVAALADLADAQAQDGWLYHCPDSGLEWSEDHPHESGQCTDATDVRPATVENLKAQLLDSWEAWAEDRERADAQAQENARLRSALERIASHNVPADDRFNGKLCGHGRSMDEDCNLCTAAYARAALGDAP